MTKKSSLLLLSVGLLAFHSSQAQLVHRYDFNSSNDSVGAANGATTGAATVGNGILSLTGANNDSFTLGANATTGLSGSFSIELFATRTVTNGGNFSNFFSFGNDTNNFLLLNPDRPGDGTRANFRQAGLNNDTELGVRSNNPEAFAPNVQTQVVLTYNGTTGAINLYKAGAAIATGMLPGFNLEQISNGGIFNGIGGNTPFSAADPSFEGSFADFRIYSQELTGDQVTALNNAGPDASNAQINTAIGAVPEPSTWAAAVAGLGALIGLRRFRRSVA